MVLTRHAQAQQGRRELRGGREAATGGGAGTRAGNGDVGGGSGGVGSAARGLSGNVGAGSAGTDLVGTALVGTDLVGMDLAELCSAIREEQSQTSEHQRTPHWQHPQREVRVALGSLLRSGRVRRSLASGGRPDPGDVEAMLRLLVINCLQVTVGGRGVAEEGNGRAREWARLLRRRASAGPAGQRRGMKTAREQHDRASRPLPPSLSPFSPADPFLPP
jgi:hypothetical protein